MTDAQLKAIEERAEKATPGPWGVNGQRGDAYWYGYVHAGDTPIDDVFREENAAFIAHSREDVPALVAEVRRLREALFHAVKRDHEDTTWCSGCERIREGLNR